jgi:hypothetical protein
MIDYDIAVDNPRLKKSPWIRPPDRKELNECDTEINEWFEESPHDKLYLFELSGSFLLPVAVVADPTDEDVDPRLRDVFKTLVSEWKEDTWFISSIKKRIAHPAYLKIIGLGKPAVPWILEELAREPDYWSYALEAITRDDAAPHGGNLQQIRDAWLAWGKAHGG